MVSSGKQKFRVPKERAQQSAARALAQVKVFAKPVVNDGKAAPLAGSKTPSSAAPRAQVVVAAQVEMVTIDDNSAGQRIDNFLLARLKGVPKSHVYRIVRAGEVRVNKGRIDVTYRLVEGDIVRVPPVRMAAPLPENEVITAKKLASVPNFTILYEDEAFFAINKPAGYAVHGGSGLDFGVIEALRAARPAAHFLELVHRIDRETSGILLIAKKRSALTGLHAQLRGEGQTRVDKRYLTLVKGKWPDETRNIRAALHKVIAANGERRVFVDEEKGQAAHTIFHRRERFATATLLEADIRTGRTHQIRVHAQHAGFPIVGDDKYGDFTLNKEVAANVRGGLKRMFLHAHAVTLTHPISGESLTIRAALPPELEKYLTFLRAQEPAKIAAKP